MIQKLPQLAATLFPKCSKGMSVRHLTSPMLLSIRAVFKVVDVFGRHGAW